MKKKKFEVGDTVKAKVRTMAGWKGTGIVFRVSFCGEHIDIIKDGGEGEALFGPHELSLVKRKKKLTIDLSSPTG